MGWVGFGAWGINHGGEGAGFLFNRVGAKSVNMNPHVLDTLKRQDSSTAQISQYLSSNLKSMPVKPVNGMKSKKLEEQDNGKTVKIKELQEEVRQLYILRSMQGWCIGAAILDYTLENRTIL